jgi:hypothetical protein
MELLLRAWWGVALAHLLVGMVLWLQAPLEDRADMPLGMGLVLLMAAPVLKLLSVLIDEVRARDWRFALLGFAVLMLLGGSVMLAMRPN